MTRKIWEIDIKQKISMNNFPFQVSVPIVSNDRCKAMFLKAGRHEFIPEIFLCAGYETGGQDSCQVGFFLNTCFG